MPTLHCFTLSISDHTAHQVLTQLHADGEARVLFISSTDRDAGQ